jgi:hypothetical protein
MSDPNKARTLYDIAADLLALESALIDAGGVIDDDETAATVDAWFDGLHEDLAAKVDDYAALIRTIEARAEARRDEAARMTARARVDENAARALKERLRDALRGLGIPKVETRRFTVSVQRNGGKAAMVFTDDADVTTAPEWAKRTETRTVWDKDAIRERLEKADDPTEAVPFARLQKPGFGLRIR